MSEPTYAEDLSKFLFRYDDWKKLCEEVAQTYNLPINMFYMFLETIYNVKEGKKSLADVVRSYEVSEYMRMVRKEKLMRGKQRSN